MRSLVLAGLVAATVLASACAARPETSAPTPAFSGTPAVTAGAPSETSTPDPGTPSVASGSPSTADLDGDWLLFEWYAGRPVKDVMLMRPDGTERHPVATDVETGLEHADATWSPDGRTIAFDVGAWYDGVSIWTVPIDGHGATKLIGPDDHCRLGVAAPSYSPDGRRLMYVCQDGTSGTSPDVHETLEVMDLGSGARTTIVTMRGQEELVWPSWSRDGTAAVFTVNTWAEDLATQLGSYVATIPLTGGQGTPLTDADSWAADPRWSPTDDVIAFGTHGFAEKDMSVRSTIETIRPDGTGRHTIWPGTEAAVGRVGDARWATGGDQLIVSVATGTDDIADIHPASLTLDGRLDRIATPMSGVAWSPRPRS